MKNSRAVSGLIVLAAALSLAGCSAAGSGGSSASDGPSTSSSTGVGTRTSSSSGTSSSSSSSASSGTGTLPTTAPDTAGDGSIVKNAASVDRSVVVTGTVTLTATSPVSAAEKAATIVEAAGGRIDGRTETAAANGDRGSATLVLRIPAAKLSATLAQLRKLGRADQVQLDSVDVTTQTQDLDARITASRTTIARLLQLETTATDTTNLIAIETAIGDRQAELESMEAQQRGLSDQVSMSTVTLQLRSDAAAPPITPADFWSGLSTGWKAFAGFWAAALVAFGVLIPWLALVAVAAGAVLLAVRVRRRQAATTDPATATPTATAAATAAAATATTPPPTPPAPIG